jgi:hypothetical protein
MVEKSGLYGRQWSNTHGAFCTVKGSIATGMYDMIQHTLVRISEHFILMTSGSEIAFGVDGDSRI